MAISPSLGHILVVYLDATHFHVRNEGRITKKDVYIAIGITWRGFMDVLGMEAGENESAKFWLSVMNDLRIEVLKTS